MSGEEIKAIRLKHGMSQEEFGSIVGVSKVAISDFENGKRKPSKPIQMAIKNSPILNPAAPPISEVHYDLSGVPTKDLLAELERRCSV